MRRSTRRRLLSTLSVIGLLLCGTSPASSTEEKAQRWLQFQDEGSRIRGYVKLGELRQTVRIFTEVALAESFAWTATVFPETEDKRIILCSDMAFLGVQGGSLVLKFENYTSELSWSNSLHRTPLKKLTADESSGDWQEYAGHTLEACLIGRSKEGARVDVLHVPISEPMGSVPVPTTIITGKTRGLGALKVKHVELINGLDVDFVTYK